jgi:hypothetical protein
MEEANRTKGIKEDEGNEGECNERNEGKVK